MARNTKLFDSADLKYHKVTVKLQSEEVDLRRKFWSNGL